ncbi:S-layer homology domain-containing protein [Peribacillus sp. JNUCC 23]
MYKKLCSVLISLFIVFNLDAAHTEAAPVSFKDVPNSFWSKDEISYLANSNIIVGYKDGTFRPNNNVTNAQVAIMLTRALNLNLNGHPNPNFSDVSSKHHAFKEIATVVHQGIFPKGEKFNPEQFITREAMSRAISNAFNLKGTSKVGFIDIPASYWAHQYVTRLAANRIVIGYPDKTFKPKSIVTRAQFSAFVARALNDSFKTQDIEEYRNQFRSIAHGLKLNPKMTYEYQHNRGNNTWKETWKYTGKSYGFDNWTAYSENGERIYYAYIDEPNRMAVGWQQSEIGFEIPYPLTLDTKWSFGDVEWNGYVDYYVVTSTTKTITTPAGTFENVIEIKNYDGYYSYYVEGIGHILTIDNTQKPAQRTSELIRYY